MAVIEALAAMLQGRLNLRRGHFVIARPQLEYALKTLEALGDADDSGLAAFLLGVADVLEGINDGWERLEGSLSRVVKPANRAELALALAGLAGVMRRRGDADHARQCVELGLEVSRSTKDRAAEAVALSVAAELEVDVGRSALAAKTRKAAAQAWKDALRSGTLEAAARKAALDVDAGA